jgi:hypothetical protein
LQVRTPFFRFGSSHAISASRAPARPLGRRRTKDNKMNGTVSFIIDRHYRAAYVDRVVWFKGA